MQLITYVHLHTVIASHTRYSKVSLFNFDHHRLFFLCPGDRAEGAEATLEANLNKLTITAAQEQEGDSEDEQDHHYTNTDISSPAAAAPILLLNHV